MRPVRKAKKYAKTLVNIVGIEAMPAALAELSAVEELMYKSKEFRSLLANPVFSLTERGNAFRQVAAKLKLSEKAAKFIMQLAELRVITALSEIIKIATAIYLEKKKRARATVLTPVEIGKNHEERLKSSLKKLTGRDVDIDFVMDTSLLGGVLVKVGSTMYDSSIKGQLRLLKNELVK
ncbi:MAG: ATP synthase F1 subunit delta [Nitrospirae bacterium]|nr:ATP synthase F1 subunit delta [Nitrospirota bacterium]